MPVRDFGFLVAAQFIYSILFSLVHDLNLILEGIQLLDGEIIKTLAVAFPSEIASNRTLAFL